MPQEVWAQASLGRMSPGVERPNPASTAAWRILLPERYRLRALRRQGCGRAALPEASQILAVVMEEAAGEEEPTPERLN